MGAAYATSPSTLGWILGATVRNHDSPPLIQPPARYRPLDLNFSTLQCSTVLLYDLGTLYTVQLYIVLDQATVGSIMHDPPVYRQDLGAQQADKPRTKQITVDF